MNPQGKTILVTGATGGIGSAVCSLLSAGGARLILSSHSSEQLRQLESTLGSGHPSIVSDISTTEGREALLAACRAEDGIDAVINLAGILDFNLYEMQAEATIERIMNVNLVGVMLLCHGLVPLLKRRPHALILNVGSTFGSIGYPGFAAYCASKAGIRCFSEALSRELADTPIRVSYIAPRATSTSLNTDRINALNAALGNKSDSPDYVAEQIVDLFAREGRTRYLGWPEKLFVRLNALLPALVHRTLVRQLPIIKRYASQ